MSKQVKVLLFASLREKTGKSVFDLILSNGTSVNDVRLAVALLFPVVKDDLDRALVAVNGEYASEDTQIPAFAEIAIFPPVSGGNEISGKPTFCRIQTDEIVIDEWISRLITPTSGAIGIFVGVVRAITLGEKPYQTEYLSYEAYIPMAEMKMLQIATEIRQRWSKIDGIAIIQRYGEIKKGTQSVLIACCAPHRNDGIFEAAHYGIERLKEIVPVWKRETGPNGQVWIEGDYKPAPKE